MNALTGVEAGSSPARSGEAARAPLVVLVGNPNVGKTSLFNRLTGANARVGNYPGVTVERRSGWLVLPSSGGEQKVELVDVPGSYSLSARSAEEQIALRSILGLSGYQKPDLCVVVVDAGQLARNLYLVVQLAELGVPLVIAVNMIDEVQDNPPDPAELGRLLGVPCIATDGRHGSGIEELRTALARTLAEPSRSRVRVGYDRELVALVDRVAGALPAELRGSVERERALALWALTSVDPDDELEGIPDELRQRCEDVREAAAERDLDRDIIAARYALIDAELPRIFARADPHPPKRKLSERADKLLLHPISGTLAFLALMFVVFQALFSWSDPMIGAIEDVFGGIAGLVTTYLPEGALRDLISEGVIGGVGNVVVFLPQILLLFFFIGLLEDSGYMARVAYLMDRVMRSLGLHGRAFVPMLSGFACAVPAILATRTMERQRDRLLTMMVVPLMTCSARLPVYTLIIAALFPSTLVLGFLPLQGLTMVGLYAFSLLLTLAVAGVLGRTVIRGRRIPLILELPPYRIPSLRLTVKLMFERAGLFLKEAGTVILVCTVALWALLSFSPDGDKAAPAPPVVATQAAQTATAQATQTAAAQATQTAAARATGTTAPAEAPPVSPELTAAEGEAAQASAIAHSFGGRLGKAIEPLLAPLGFDWRLGVGLIGAFAAREVFVSTLGIVFGLGEQDDEAVPLRERLAADATGKPVYSPLVGLSLLVFFAIACQCMSTLAVVKRETGSYRWPAFLFAYTLGLAYSASFVVYQGGKLLGF